MVHLFDLSPGALEKVCANMHVCDRTRFLVTCVPRSYKWKIPTRPRDKEKQLGIVAKAIKTKRVRKISCGMKQIILHSLSSDDPTLQDMVEDFPEELRPVLMQHRRGRNARDNHHNISSHSLQVNPMSIREKLLTDVFTEQDISFLEEENDSVALSALASVRVFRMLMSSMSPLVHKIRKEFCMLVFSIVNCANGPLLDHVYREGIHLYSFDVSSGQHYILSGRCPVILCTQRNDGGARLRLLLQYHQVPKEVLEYMYSEAVQVMDTDLADIIDRELQSIHITTNER